MGLMKLTDGIILVLIITETVLFLVQTAESASGFTKCYNTSDQVRHCFSAQLNGNSLPLITQSFDEAQNVCQQMNATLLVNRNEEIDGLVRQFMKEPDYPLKDYYAWIYAYRVTRFNEHTWIWVNKQLPAFPGNVTGQRDIASSVAAIEYEYGDDFYLKSQRPDTSVSHYMCEYNATSCSTNFSRTEIIFDNRRCYKVTREKMSWYQARNRCLKGGGDLASFEDFSGTPFRPWLVPSPVYRYWVGLRFTWYIWKDTGDDAKYTNWDPLNEDWISECLVVTRGPGYLWKPNSCNSSNNSIGVVCHKVNPNETPVNVTTVITKNLATTDRSEQRKVSSFTPTIRSTEQLNMSSVISIAQENNPWKSKNDDLVVPLAVGIGVPFFVALVVLSVFLIWWHRKQNSTTSKHYPIRGPPELKNRTNQDRNDATAPIYNHRRAVLPLPISKEAPEATGNIESTAPAYGTVLSTLSKNAATEYESTKKVDYAQLEFS